MKYYTRYLGSAAIILLVLAAALCEAQVHHNLEIALEPQQQAVRGIDTIRVGPPVPEILRFDLAPQARIASVTAGGIAVPFKFQDGVLEIEGAPIRSGNPLVIEYTAVFNDPAPGKPLNTDNPGYGVSGTIHSQGTLLLAGAGWYPSAENDGGMDLSVAAPRGILAVTSGNLVGHIDRERRSISRWRIPAPASRASLTAGPFIRRTLPAGDGVVAATYFTQPLDDLASAYLDATAGYLRMYTELFGPYAFNQFAVVENFFPTGYGFAGYTLMGRSVLRLPFIIHTSLGHEVAHSWWGNGVQVDYSHGNWSEGLTTYVADYLFKERQSQEAARQYRLQWLRNYANLVDPGSDFALSRFISRTDPVSKTIGYDKSAMVFHMLRQTVGDAIFWKTLKDIYTTHRFEKLGWLDLRRAFEKSANRSLATFFNQWVYRPGAPRLTLARVQSESGENGYTVSGYIAQQGPVYSLDVVLQLDTDRQSLNQRATLDNEKAGFRFSTPGPPRKLVADPQVNLFRRLAPEEIPVTINTIKGSDEVILWVSRNLDQSWMETARQLSISLGLTNARIVRGPDGIPAGSAAVIRIGMDTRGVPPAPAPVSLQADAEQFAFQGRVFDRGGGASFFGVYESDGRPMALFLPATDRRAAEEALLKVTHYGKYSYLIFDGARNQVKGVWPVTESPLVHDFTGFTEGDAARPNAATE